jgi:Cu+-exporting ATPase
LEAGLDHFYDLKEGSGQRVSGTLEPNRWAYLDEPDTREGVLDFNGEHLNRVTFSVPAIHCVACVWLLENLFRLRPGIGQSTANFPRREVSIAFTPQKIRLSELAALLTSIGYEPQITMGKLDKTKPDASGKKQWLQTGIAGFGFGNIMLATLPLYIGLDTFSGPFLRALLGGVSLALALPVVTYSASDYWKSALASVRQRTLTLDVPIVMGLAALYFQSAYEIISATGGGYLDSLCGLIFFLLLGRIFQRKTHDRIAFDRDYRSFFPLASARLGPGGEESVSIAAVKVGDRLRIRHGELTPADGTLLSGAATIDYSFVTGESAPVSVDPGGRVYAGGRQTGGAIEIETVKPVSQSYLTSLWNHKVFSKDSEGPLHSLTNVYSRRFTRIVIVIACASAVGWWLAGDAPRGLKAFTSVLIVACPCALALAAPFTLGSAQRVLAKLSVFVRNPIVLERMGRVTTVVFDKTGTLTAPGQDSVTFAPAASRDVPETEMSAILALAAQSTHPNAAAIARHAAPRAAKTPQVDHFQDFPGKGLAGIVEGRPVRLGSASWLRDQGIRIEDEPAGSASHAAIDGVHIGAFVISQALRAEAATLLESLRSRYELALLSGDNERERERFRALLGQKADLLFNRNPVQKLEWIESLKQGGAREVMMVGDGLNDAGALRGSDVGVAVVDQIGSFSPASDVVMEAAQVRRLGDILALARASVRIVRLSFGLSAAYNAVGISIAASGVLSPIICAILMPLSSLSVVLFAYGMTNRAGRKLNMETES